MRCKNAARLLPYLIEMSVTLAGATNKHGDGFKRELKCLREAKDPSFNKEMTEVFLF